VPASKIDGRRFVVQRHRARNLHYDFRLEIGDVLVSWAVPKGPTLDPGVRRAAFHVEDHQLDYFDFEGVIPAGQYGGGDVIVWDVGTWEHHQHRAGRDIDPAQAVADGEIHFDLWGAKLRGRFALVRTRTNAAGKEQWLLLHKHDDAAVEGWDPEDYPRSVLSGRTNEEIKDPRVTSDELAALDALPGSGRWRVYGRDLRVTNLDKILFPARPGEGPVTKRELLRYAAQIAPTALPYLARRAMNLHRFPNGAQTKGFWHKQLPDHVPDWLPRWDNPDAAAGEARTYLVADEPAALVWAANYGALEWHPWTSRIDRPDRPTYALIDLDPGETTSWEDLLVLARLHRTAFEHLGITARPKLSGLRGIQIWVPAGGDVDFDQTRRWVEDLSKAVGGVVPEMVSWRWQKASRSGRARLDYTQNAVNRTLVAPYSPRPVAGATVSAPIEWDELDDPQLRPGRFTIRNIVDRVADKGDLFRDVLDQSQSLPVLR
jgi:bifunctional non-homologous end joining protein LigD